MITFGGEVYPSPEAITAIETIRPLITIGCATAPSPEFSLIVGEEVYDCPALVTEMLLIGPRTAAVAVAPAPSPPDIETNCSEVGSGITAQSA